MKELLARVKNYRTTIAGVLTLLGSSITFVATWAASGEFPDATHWNLLGVGLSTGAGLIASADAKTTAHAVDMVKSDVAELKEQS